MAYLSDWQTVVGGSVVVHLDLQGHAARSRLDDGGGAGHDARWWLLQTTDLIRFVIGLGCYGAVGYLFEALRRAVDAVGPECSESCAGCVPLVGKRMHGFYSSRQQMRQPAQGAPDQAMKQRV